MVTIDRKDDYDFVRWANEIKRRDFYTCQVCARRGVELNAHHILSWSDNPNERYDIENGVTLCKTCHDNFHEIYGKGGNNGEQFDEFCKIAQELIVEVEFQNAVEEQTRKAIRFIEGYSKITEIVEDLNNGTSIQTTTDTK